MDILFFSKVEYGYSVSFNDIFDIISSLSRKDINMKSNLFLWLKFRYTLFKTKATIFVLYCRNIWNKEHTAKVKHFESILDEAKQSFTLNLLYQR